MSSTAKCMHPPRLNIVLNIKQPCSYIGRYHWYFWPVHPRNTPVTTHSWHTNTTLWLLFSKSSPHEHPAAQISFKWKWRQKKLHETTLFHVWMRSVWPHGSGWISNCLSFYLKKEKKKKRVGCEHMSTCAQRTAEKNCNNYFYPHITKMTFQPIQSKPSLFHVSLAP